MEIPKQPHIFYSLSVDDINKVDLECDLTPIAIGAVIKFIRKAGVKCMYAPVVLFVYNRTDHTKQVLQALDQNIGVEESELFIFSDAPADETEKKSVDEVRKYIDAYRNNSQFRKVKICKAEKNKGLSTSLIEGITAIINQFGRIIVLEDDILTSSDFIKFMNEALDYYENDYKIWSIAGYTPDLRALRHYKKDVYCGCRGNCWGWATWKDRFNKVDWEVKDYKLFIKNRRDQKKFNRGGMDMTHLLKMQQEGKVDSWAIRWCYQEYKENMLTIFPRNSKVKNIGFDGSGTNSGSGNLFHSRFKVEKEWNFSYDEKDSRAFKAVRNYHSRLYIRQLLGKYWYELTEYEYCVLFRFVNGKDKSYHFIKPDFRRWYADPIPFCFQGKYYVFMEMFDKIKGKGCIGVSHIYANGKVSKPIKIIEESFHMSFPNVFYYRGQVYMIPECEESGQIRIYRMEENNIKKWKLYYLLEGWRNIVDVAVCEKENSELYFLASEVNDNNWYQAKLILLCVKELNDIDKIDVRVAWRQEEYSYAVRNGGNFFYEGGEMFRIAQHSTKDIYGKFITWNRIKQLGEDGLWEEIEKKISVSDMEVSLPKFIYRVWGIHTYGRWDNVEVADLQVQRFSLGGLLWKIYRRIF